MLLHAPTLSVIDAADVARVHFGLEGEISALPSERDQNWLIDAGSEGRFVLKIANAAESRALLEAQQAMMGHVTGGTLRSALAGVIPRVRMSTSGESLVTIAGAGGTTHLAWMITAVTGQPMAAVRWHSPELHRDVGRMSGELTRALDGFDHPAIYRDFYWDIANARRIVAEHRALIADADLSRAIDGIAAAFDRFTAPRLGELATGAVHGDLNDHNILVGGGSNVDTRHQRVTGLVDFGDIVHTYVVADLAIAVAYVMAVSDEPLLAATDVVRGRHAVVPLAEPEMAALFGLAAIRLCASACIAAHQQAQRPDNSYLAVTQPAIRRILPMLAETPFAFAEGVMRRTCGLPPAPTHERVVRWIESQRHTMPNVIGFDLRTEPSIVLDWSIASPSLGADESENTEPIITENVFGAMRRANVEVSIGRYDEPRLLYVSTAFANGGRITDERRTVHIGLDLFAVAGTPVFAPFDGTVHAFADNDAPCDFGPVIILEHVTGDGTPFFTLYGHLSRESLVGLSLGQRVKAGDQIATFGVPGVNGNWTPHLHLGVMTDMFGLGTEFPGVARPSFRAEWLSFCPDPNLIARVPADRFPAPSPTKAQTLAQRRERLGRNLSIGYREPVKIVRGWKQYLFDDEGRRFVDAYNNVPHVGHGHPRVVHAAADQMRVLNTNTRYLNDLVAEYAERLTATLPAPLSVSYLLNSASEANELAIRLARAHTKARDMIVLDAAYHGNTTGLIDLSPYKHAGPGGSGAPDWVHVAPLPDDYRGPFKRDNPAAGVLYAAQVSAIIDALRSSHGRLAGFIAETCPSVGGQLILPPGYLREVYHAVRGAGGLCIADEVQTGLGRIGSHFWAFQSHDVVPDIVVMGKPLGNGHPIAAVVTTPVIAASFDNGMEFFSTFGGNTVSCAVGIAVLDVIRDEGLQAHALTIGERMLGQLRALMGRHPLIGDVRGSGLFLGVELVRDRETLTPASDEASFVVNRMRERGVLAGTDGPFHNVVKIRPPMPIGAGDADLVVAELERGLELLLTS